jgi:hypothetical protein
MALNGLGRGSQALARFDSALQISPDYVPALEGASEIEYKTGSPQRLRTWSAC